MELQVTGHNVEILPTVRSYLEKKLNKLDRHLPNLTTVKVDVAEQATKSKEQRFVAQVTLDVDGVLLRSEERAENLVTAIDRVVPALDRQIEKYKGKVYRKNRAVIATRAQPEEVAPPPDLQATPAIVRTKRFPVRQMTVEEAANQMELLGHNFFLFLNPETKEVNVVYRRKDGDYSVIEPELE